MRLHGLVTPATAASHVAKHGGVFGGLPRGDRFCMSCGLGQELFEVLQ